MKTERRNILWLVSWYPNKTDRFTGDFIQRHAQAASLFHNIHVILVTGVSLPNYAEETFTEDGGLSERIIYFQKKESAAGKIVNAWEWRKLYARAVRDFIKTKGRPHLVHVHVAWQCGLMAQWMKKKWRIPYFITEHWGMYNHVLSDNFYTKPYWLQTLIKLIFQRSDGLVTVSRFIAFQINQIALVKTIDVVPNVVNTDLFFYQPDKNEVFTFIHVSGMAALKNVVGIIRGYTIFKRKNLNIQSQLLLIGGQTTEVEEAINESGLPVNEIILTGEVSYAEVAAYMRSAHCLILNSVMENSPCVIGEALCCGLPVISTNVGGIPELVTEENSILISVKDDESLAEAIQQVKSKYATYDGLSISEKAIEKFSYRSVGKTFSDLYENYIEGR